VWPNNNDDLLISWYSLRLDNTENNIEQALQNVNDWWQMAPISMHYLHWDTVKDWPDPWDLLADGIYCGLAKAVGISYTLLLMNRPDINDLTLLQTDEGDNLVQVNQGIYILNWAPGEMLNINTQKFRIAQSMEASMFEHKIN
jgi:hypothetical protein